jgi:hypothetical protein
MEPNLRVLTLTAFGETAAEDYEVTLSAMAIKMVAAQDGVVQDRPVKTTTILFMDSEPVTLHLSPVDLLQLQSVVGAYGFLEN